MAIIYIKPLKRMVTSNYDTLIADRKTSKCLADIKDETGKKRTKVRMIGNICIRFDLQVPLYYYHILRNFDLILHKRSIKYDQPHLMLTTYRKECYTSHKLSICSLVSILK